jgi:hypothetical protein
MSTAAARRAKLLTQSQAKEQRSRLPPASAGTSGAKCGGSSHAMEDRVRLYHP